MKPRIIKTKDYSGLDRRSGTDRRQDDRTVCGGTFYITKDAPVGNMKPCRRTSSSKGDRRLVERAKKQIRTTFYINGTKDAISEYREVMQELANRVKQKEISPENASVERANLKTFLKKIIKGDLRL